jgi:hypothetical protein
VEKSSSQLAAPVPALTAAVQKSLRLLLDAHAYAQDTDGNVWDFAVELPALLAAGATASALRWLVRQGYAEAGIEITQPADPQRSFQKLANLAFPANTCFVLTAAGVALAEQVAEHTAVREDAAAKRLLRLDGAGPVPGPHWDAELRELRLGSRIVKEFKQPAPNQETILAAFEEDGWPARIDNPLPGPDAKQKLHDTITRLNRHQRQPLLHFHADNNGQGVRWTRTL